MVHGHVFVSSDQTKFKLWKKRVEGNTSEHISLWARRLKYVLLRVIPVTIVGFSHSHEWITTDWSRCVCPSLIKGGKYLIFLLVLCLKLSDRCRTDTSMWVRPLRFPLITWVWSVYVSVNITSNPILPLFLIHKRSKDEFSRKISICLNHLKYLFWKPCDFYCIFLFLYRQSKAAVITHF